MNVHTIHLIDNYSQASSHIFWPHLLSRFYSVTQLTYV
ncbi:uncharacterized protein METZ01_LOCUS475881, partial [marine metagenome]